MVSSVEQSREGAVELLVYHGSTRHYPLPPVTTLNWDSAVIRTLMMKMFLLACMKYMWNSAWLAEVHRLPNSLLLDIIILVCCFCCCSFVFHSAYMNVCMKYETYCTNYYHWMQFCSWWISLHMCELVWDLMYNNYAGSSNVLNCLLLLFGTFLLL